MKTGRNIAKVIFTLLIMVGVITTTQAQYEKEFAVESFTRLEADGILKVYLMSSDMHKIRVESKSPIDNVFDLEVVDGTMEIESKWNTNGKSWKQEALKVFISFVELRTIEAKGMVDIESKNGKLKGEKLNLELQGATQTKLDIEVDKLNSEISGAAKLTLSGKARHHTLEASGAANVKAYDLETLSTNAEVSGASMAYVNASEELTGSSDGISQLHFKDKPARLNIDKSGSVEEMVRNGISKTHYKDSVKVKVGKFDVQVIDSDTTVIKIGRSQISIDNQGNIEVGKDKRKRRFDGHWSGFYLGVNGYMTPDNELSVPEVYEELDLTYEKSINVQLNVFEQNFNLIRERFGLVTGLGFEWDNYRFDNDVLLVEENDGLAFEEPNPDKSYEKSKLVVSYLNLPLFFEFQTNSGNNISSFHIGAGTIGGLRIGSHSKNIINGNKNKNRNDFHLSPFKLDGIVRIGWGKLNLYTAYDMVPLFKDNKGPELYPFNVGIQLLGF